MDKGFYTAQGLAEVALGRSLDPGEIAFVERAAPWTAGLRRQMLFWPQEPGYPGMGLAFLHRLVEERPNGVDRRTAFTVLEALLQAPPVPEIPWFDGPIFLGSGDASAIRMGEAVAMLGECFTIVGGLQQGPVIDDERAEGLTRCRAYLREIVRAVTGDEVEFKVSMVQEGGLES